MRPYNIHIHWIDYDVTNEDDLYEVQVTDSNDTQIITSWQTSARNLHITLERYLRS